MAGLVDSPVTIKNIEYSIVERAWEEGWITPRIPNYRSGMSVAVVGSGPAGECCCVAGVVIVAGRNEEEPHVDVHHVCAQAWLRRTA